MDQHIEAFPRGDGHDHECDACGGFIADMQSHFVVDGETWCTPCANDAGVM